MRARKLIALLLLSILLLSMFACADNGSPTQATPTISQEESPNQATPAISQEDAVEIAARMLSDAIVARSDIKAELHGWYWQVVFDNLNATYSELTPFPIKPPISPPPGEPDPMAELYEKIYQRVVMTIDAETGDLLTAGADEAPSPGPYVSEEQAIASAQECIADLPLSDRTWLDDAVVEAYLCGDTWVVLFYDPEAVTEGPSLTAHRIRVLVDALSGHVEGAGRS